MSSAGAPDHVIHVKLPAQTAIERINARLKVGAQRTNLQDVLQQLSPDLFLIGFRQRLNLIQSLFKYLDHDGNLS
jgi:hypothetical protein